MINVRTLKNGLRVVMEPIPFVRSISFGIWIRNGSRNENEGNNGISHFLEHLMFKGTESRSAMEIAEAMDAVGGQMNAFTANEYTCFNSRTLDSHFETALEIVSDIFLNSKFEEEDIEKERNVILEEISMYEDTPEDLVHGLLHNGVWQRNPLGFMILGTPESIKNIARGDFIEYYKTHYVAERIIISVAGNMDEDDILNKLEKVFGSIPRGGEAGIETEKAVYAPSFTAREKDIEQTHLCVGFPGIPSGSDESYAMAAVNTLFGGGMSSRLFQKIREERGLAYAVYSFNSGYSDAGLFGVYSAQTPSQTDDVLRLIIEETRRLFTERITCEQLSKTREQIKSNFLLSLESSFNRMNSIGRTLMVMNRTVSVEELIEKIDAVDLDMFYNLCEKIFKPERISISIVGPAAEKIHG